MFTNKPNIFEIRVWGSAVKNPPTNARDTSDL